MKMDVANLAVWGWEDFCEYWGYDLDQKDDFNSGIRVLKFEIGCRGEEEFIGDMEVVDNCFECRDTAEIQNWITEQEGDDADFEFASGMVENWFKGANGEMLNVYGENYFEEFGYVYVRVEV